MSGFETATYQLELWADPHLEQARRLQPVLDELRDRFGRRAIQRGSRLKRADQPED